MEIILTVDEARRGGRVWVRVPAQVRCPTCGGRGGLGFFGCWRCEGEGILTGEVPLLVAFPPGLVEDHVVQIPLDRLGIHNVYLTVRFRVSREGE